MSSTPILLKPILFIIASSLISLNNLFFGLPSWAFGVTVPISIKPKPKVENSLYKRAFLSKPAAKPTGFGKLIPNNLVSIFEFFKEKIFDVIDETNGSLKIILVKRKTSS
jgi:hypothetical protein